MERREQGSAMILSIMMMMSLGILMLTTLGQHLTGALSLTAHEHRYLLARENAVSSLNWGLKQLWPLATDDRWRCQHLDVVIAGLSQQLNSCIRPSLREDIVLVKGEGKVGERASPLALFQQAVSTTQPDGSRALIALKQGWLDFCPESDPKYCEADSLDGTDAKGI